MNLIDTIVFNKATDPSRSLSLRNAFARAMRIRFAEFVRILILSVQEDDVFGLSINRRPGQHAFNFPRSADKISAFMDWVAGQVQESILDVSQINQVHAGANKAWTNKFIQDSYKKGILKARTQMRGVAPSIATTGGIEASLLNFSHVDRIGSLYTRTFNELKGVTDTMIQQISRVVSQGVTDQISPKVFVLRINEIVFGQRARVVTNVKGGGLSIAERAEITARTEIIRAYAEAQLTEFESWGVEGVTAKAELVTAGDERVCPRCASLERQIISIEEARGVIPVHPLCRCIWVPFIDSKK